MVPAISVSVRAQAPGGLIHNNHSRLRRQGLEHFQPPALAPGQEAHEKYIPFEPGKRERRHPCGRAGHRLHPHPRLPGPGHQVGPGVRKPRSAGVAHQGHGFPAGEPPDQLRPPGCLVVGVVADERRPDPEVAQKLAGVAGVLRGDEVHLFQHPQGPQGDVLQVADGGGDDVERADGTHLKTRSE